MKKFNLKLMTPLLLTFILQGCMPDSLTKFKKDPPKKAPVVVTATSQPVVDSTGATVVVSYPTVSTFNFTEANSTIAIINKDFKVGKIETLASGVSDTTSYGSLADPTKRAFIFLRCTLNTSGALLTQALPPGMSLNAETCEISGTPTRPYSEDILGIPTNISYTVDLYYKGANYNGAGTESKLTGTISLGSYYFDDSGVKDTTAIDYPTIAPFGFSYTEKISGVATAVGTKDMEVGTAIEFNPATLGQVGAPDGVGGTLSNPVRSKYIFEKCALNASGPSSSRSLPPGLTLDENTCLISGTPSTAFTDTTFGNMGGLVTYNIDLFYKGPTYLGPGTQVKVTTQLKLMSHAKPVLDTTTWIAPTSFTLKLEGSSTSTTTANFEINSTTRYGAVLDGTLSIPAKYDYSFVSCTLDATTPTLPAGLFLNQALCILGGTPTAIPGANPSVYKINLKYKDPTYTGPGTEQTIQANITLGVYIKPTLLTYNQHDRLLVKVDSTLSLGTNTATSDYVRAGLLTSSTGVTGVIKFLDTVNSLAGVVKIIPLTVASATGFVANEFVYTAGGAIGKIQKVSSNVVYVERLTPTINFVVAEGISHSAVYPAGAYVAGGATTISSIDTTFNLDLAVTGFDNDEQYYSSKYTMNIFTRVYSKGVAIESITPQPSTQTVATNGFVYSINPALPPGLSFSTSTGAISGTFSAILDSTKFTITATNPLGSTSFSLYLSAIEAPVDLSITNKQIVTVGASALFNEGEDLFDPIVAPKLEGTKGQIRKIIDGNTLALDVFNGLFAQNSSIDSGNAYYSEKSYILADNSCSDPSYTSLATCTGASAAWSSGSYYYNIALTVASSTNFTEGGYISTAAGALGKVVKKDSANHVLYVQFLTNSSSYVVFKEGSSVDNVATYVGAESTISQVENDNLKITLSAVGFNKGDDLATSDTLRSGYIYKAPSATPTIVYVSDITRNNAATFFRRTQVVSNSEKYSAANGAAVPPIVNATINDVENENLFTIERGVNAYLKANLTTGNVLTYSITPSLPTGLVLDTKTGTISGKATTLSAEKNYVLIAQNLIGITYYYFKLEIRDYFTLGQTSAGSSFLMHKFGDSQQSRKCRVNATDILSGTQNANALDIRCMLEAEEEDVYFNPIKFAASAGAGICEFVQYTPYYFWQYSPIQTNSTVDYQTGCAGAAGVPGGATTTLPTAENSCLGNYTADEGPNCDEGKVTVTTYTTADVSGTCSITGTATTEIKCAGKAGACINGPVKDLLSDTAINNGMRSVIYSTATGLTKDWTLSSPISKGNSTNLRVSNNVVGNQCSLNRKDAEDWSVRARKKSAYASPFGLNTPFYMFNCLNAAQEIKARIRVVVREWDQSFKIVDNLSYNTPAKMNKLTAVDPIFSKAYNDNSDWDDDYAGTGAGIYGSCTNPIYNNSSDCTGGGGVWTANAASCTGGTIYAAQPACEAAGYSWTVCGAPTGGTSVEHAFPEGSL